MPLEEVLLPEGVLPSTWQTALYDAAASFHWQANMLEADLALPYSRHICWGEGKQLIAYLSGHLIAGEFTVNQVYVQPDYRGQSYGSQLLARFLDLGASWGVEAVYLEVRASNYVARQLYQQAGFTELAQRKNYYKKPTEDAIIMYYQM
ncbi:ribosomal-protein-alanine N-acetyltransferase [Suicoccus acidiformans]|uniref:[Ribosomal protein bS18]-alanine N-acetyltransferase n=1 Tax=Suicoccus acidiformans TaxID=2036206 RepID=A0A347WHX4_9LACT|nr:ribosomal protein S18-alanine N-acetyltransferase [Suicoccus acidiformans]AXY24681.1 ribosomal-protein-alanine N-acetyltransferase [Suicoccus acidiformans]